MITGHLPELLAILGMVLIIFGPKRLPEVGSSLGKGIRDFRQGLSQLDGEAAQIPAPVVVESEPIQSAGLERRAG